MPTTVKRRRSRALAAAVAIATIAMTASIAAAPASAAVEWKALYSAGPTSLTPTAGDTRDGGILIWPANSGDTFSSAFPTITVDLPAGVTVTEAGMPPYWDCLGIGASSVTCSLIFPFPMSPYAYAPIPLGLVLDVAPGAEEGIHDVSVKLEGGDAPEAETTVERLVVDSSPNRFRVVPDSFEAGTFDADGNPFTQAGGTPYEASTSFEVSTKFNDPADNVGDGSEWLQMVETTDNLKDAIVDVPAGLVGNATNIPKCRDIEAVASQTCPPSSQVGVIAYDQRTQMAKRMAGIYNMQPDGNLPAQFAFDTPVDQPVTLIPTVRSDGDWGLSIKAANLNEGNPVFASRATLWGVPSDPSHDSQRCALPNEITGTCVGVDSLGVPAAGGDLAPDSYDPHSSNAPRLPFISNPTECTGEPETTAIHLDGWSNPGPLEADGDPVVSDGRWVSASAEAPPIDGCDALAFSPSIRIQPTETAPETPTGLDIELTVPQNDDPNGVATAHLRDTKVLLPEGMVVNPSGVRGIAACSSAQIGLTSKSPVRFSRLAPSCPQESKIGTVEVSTPLLDEPLTGSVFLAAQADNPFDSLLAMYIVVRGPGILGKLAAHIEPNPATGRLTTTVLDNPQVPFDVLKMRIDGGPTAPLTTPRECGAKTTATDFSSWAGDAVSVVDTFQIDCPGTGGLFDPGFMAGTSNPVAGRFAPLSARITRSAGKDLDRLTMRLPEGLLGSVRDVAVCSDASVTAAETRPGRSVQTSASCPAGAQVGTVTTGAGSGPTPYFPRLPGSDVSGRIFLTGAHRSQFPAPPGTAPLDYGLAVEVPAVAGPFDLGTVVVRVALYTDPETTRLTAVSDRLPRILQGIPLDIRDIRANFDRSGFAVNPTSCAEKRVEATIGAQDGTTAERSSRFQVGDCGALGLKPRISMSLVGRKQTKSGGNPAVRARLRQAGGQSNLRNVKVTLPPSLALDARNAAGDWLCSFEDGQRATCPAGSRIGSATAYSPLLKRPVSGPVYFVKNVRVDKRTGNRIRTLPTLLFKLSGEADIVIRAKSSVVSNDLVTTFTNLPDARVSRFDLRIRGGAKRGILAVTGKDASLCDGKQIATSDIRGHNGKRHQQRIAVKTPCAKKGGRKR